MATFDEHFAEAGRRHPEFWAFLGALEFVDDLVAEMDAQGVSGAELARRMGTSRAWVSRVLAGECNMTFASMSKLALGLGMRVTTQLMPAVDDAVAPKRIDAALDQRHGRRKTA